MKSLMIRARLYLRVLVAILAGGVFGGGCHQRGDAVKQREAYFADNPATVTVGIAWSTGDDLFHQGVELAIEQVNQAAGPAPELKTRNFQLPGLKLHHLSSPATAILTYRNLKRYSIEGIAALAKKEDVLAVIGHRNSELALSASIIYQINGIVYICTGATATPLTHHGMDKVFRINHNAQNISEGFVTYAETIGELNPLIVYERSLEGLDLAHVFQLAAGRRKGKIAETIPYTATMTDFRPILDVMKNAEFNTIVVFGGLPGAVTFIEQARAQGYQETMLVSEVVYDHLLRQKGSAKLKDIVTVRHFNPQLDNESTQKFVREFRQRFGKDPDGWAASGYDAIHLVAKALRSKSNINLSQFRNDLRYLRDYTSVTGGNIAFDDFGDNKNATFFYYRLVNGQSELIAVDTQKTDSATEQTDGYPLDGGVFTEELPQRVDVRLSKGLLGQ